MGASRTSIESLFSSGDASDLGIGAEASDILIAGLNAGTLPMCVGTPVDQFETDNVTIIQFFLDASPSMEGVADILIDTFNETMIDGLKGASKQSASTIVVGGLAFSDRSTPLWGGGFKKLSELGKLTKREYNPNRGNGTNLYGAQRDAILAGGAYGTTVLQETGTPPKIIVVGLTDGADNHHEVDPSDIKTLVESMSKELWRFPMAVFETYERVDGKKIAADTGFEVFNFARQNGESEADVQRRFRHMLGTMSSSLVAASKQQIGQASQAQFWTQ